MITLLFRFLSNGFEIARDFWLNLAVYIRRDALLALLVLIRGTSRGETHEMRSVSEGWSGLFDFCILNLNLTYI